MTTKARFAVTVLVFAIVGVMLDPHTPLGTAIWGPMPEDGPAPSGPAMALFLGVLLVQAAAFGVGAGLLLFGFPAILRLLRDRARARGVHLALVWSLMSWVPHAAMHETAGPDLGKLLATEYIFHVTLILGAAGIAWSLVRGAQAHPDEPAPARAVAPFTVVAGPGAKPPLRQVRSELSRR